MKIIKLLDGYGENYIVGEGNITHIENITHEANNPPMAIFRIYKDDVLWRKLYLPKAIIEYDTK